MRTQVDFIFIIYVFAVGSKYFLLFLVQRTFFKQCFQYISNECNFVVTYLHLDVDSTYTEPSFWYIRMKKLLGQMNVEIIVIYWCTTVLNVQLLNPSSFFLPLTTTHHWCPFPIRFTLNILFFALLKSRTCS